MSQAKERTMIQTNLVYLDTSFIVEAYESIKKKRVPMTITKTTDKSAGLSVGFIDGRASVQETMEFPFSGRYMYEEIKSELNTLPMVELQTVDYDSLTDIFWVNGVFIAGHTEVNRNGEVIHADSFFLLQAKNDKKKFLSLLTSDIYFSTGYERILELRRSAARGFAIQARVLIKLLAIQEKGFAPLCAALVIEKQQ